MNYSHPVSNVIQFTDKEKQYQKEDLDNILDQQITICYLSNGITFTDTENMDAYERNYTLSKLLQFKKEENEAKLKAIKEAQQK